MSAAANKKPRKPGYRLPCPGQKKGAVCRLCGCQWVCAQSSRPKAGTPS